MSFAKALSPVRVHDRQGNEMVVSAALPALISLIALIVFHSVVMGVSGALLYARLQAVEKTADAHEQALKEKASTAALVELEKRIDRKESEVAATLREIQTDIKLLLSRQSPPR